MSERQIAHFHEELRPIVVIKIGETEFKSGLYPQVLTELFDGSVHLIPTGFGLEGNSCQGEVRLRSWDICTARFVHEDKHDVPHADDPDYSGLSIGMSLPRVLRFTR